jgi:hypothetical protein
MSGISRRSLFGMGIGAAAASLIPATVSTRAYAAQSASMVLGSSGDPATNFTQSIASAGQFLNFMMDAYATGSTTRLIQSYSDSDGLLSTAFTYDNAVAIDAYLLSGDSDSLARAEVLGNGLIYAQSTNFPVNDGRFAQAYFVNTEATDGSGAFITPAANPFYFYTSAVGDQAWAGMALAHLYRSTHKQKYLTAALAVANWIVTNTYSTLGPGGYSFGTTINQYNQSVPSGNGKSTEHNIDTYAFFTMLDVLTQHGSANNGATWASLARHALLFVLAMYNHKGGYFYTGTLSDQITINPAPIPEDCQTWSYLALVDNLYKGSIDWALANLQTTDTPSARASSLTGSEAITGMVFDTASLSTTVSTYDPAAVWIEGTAHTVAALVARAIAGQDTVPQLFSDLVAAIGLLENIRTAQSELGDGQTVGGQAIPAGTGLVASTSPMDTGFGYGYFPALHIGATGWYLIAVLGGNPFILGYTTIAV